MPIIRKTIADFDEVAAYIPVLDLLKIIEADFVDLVCDDGEEDLGRDTEACIPSTPKGDGRKVLLTVGHNVDIICMVEYCLCQVKRSLYLGLRANSRV